MNLKKYIRSVPDYPKKGILFRDITTLIKNSEAFNYTLDKIVETNKLERIANALYVLSTTIDEVDSGRYLR